MDVVDVKEERKLGERMVDMTFEQFRHGCTGVEEHVGEVGTCTSRGTSALSFAYRLSIKANVHSFEQCHCVVHVTPPTVMHVDQNG